VKGELPRCVLTATDQLLIVVGGVLACIAEMKAGGSVE